ncbi:MAG: hypothetical protein ACP5N2_05035 [Candidatus Nanoarchaeia archaeon]
MFDNTRRSVINQGRYKREVTAEIILNNVLNAKMPQDEDLRVLYSPVEIMYVIPMLEDFILKEIKPVLDSGKKIRELGDVENTSIYLAKKGVSNSILFRDVDKIISNGKVPDQSLFAELCGNYDVKSIKSISAFTDLRIMRKCDLAYALHLFRSAFMALELGLDKESGLPCNYSAALWLKHDDVEELLYRILDYGQLKYGLKGLKRFMDDYIDEDMQEDILLVTNKSELILKQLKADNKKFSSKHELNSLLQSMSHERDYFFIRDDIEQMLTAINGFKDPADPKFFEENMKLFLYDKVFIHKLGEDAFTRKYWAHFEGKGLVDLFDNYTGILSGNLDEKRKTLIKMNFWFKKAEELITRVKQNNEIYDVYEKSLEKSAVEMADNINNGASELIISYITRQLEPVGHLRSALKTIIPLKDVLYVK